MADASGGMNQAQAGRPGRWWRSSAGRAKLAIALVVVTALSNVRLLWSIGEYWHGPVDSRDTIAAYAARFAALKAALPHDAVVGYVEDGRPSPRTFTAFSMARYVLAPVRVLRTTHAALVVANLDHPDGAPRGEGVDSLSLVRDFGDGVRLYRNRTKE